VTPPPFSVRSRVHEYGGGAFAVENGVVYFCNDADQQVYRQEPGRPPQQLTSAADLRFADIVVDEGRHRIICVAEDHSGSGEPTNTIVSVDVTTGAVRNVVSGRDFYSSPRLSPDGRRLAWLSWDHPNMPWDESSLWTASVEADGSLESQTLVAGANGEAIGLQNGLPREYCTSSRIGRGGGISTG